jgi:hypothetical protein
MKLRSAFWAVAGCAILQGLFVGEARALARGETIPLWPIFYR